MEVGEGPVESRDSIDLTGIHVEKRLEDKKVMEADLSSWKDENKEANRKDVGHLIRVWEEKKRFYWVPRGSEFPGLDSVYRDHSKVYFIQVKTGEVAKDGARWIEGAFLYSKLLLEALGSPTGIKVTILVGSEPSKCPVLGKRKRSSIDKRFSNVKNYKMATWPIRYVTAPSTEPASRTALEPRDLDMDLYHELLPKFSGFLSLTGQDDEEDGDGCA